MLECKLPRNQNPIKIDRSTYEETARVLDVINPSVNNFDGFMRMMLDMTTQYGEDQDYFGTAGFYIVCFTDDQGERHAKAVLMPFSVERYLKQIGKIPASRI